MLSSTDEDVTGSQWTQEDDAEDIFKSSGLDETSPIGYDADEQAAVHDELKDFLGSDDESESDTESLLDEPTGGKKRKRNEDTESGTDEESGDDDGEDHDKQGSRLSQRIKRSYERNTKLREITSAPASGSDQISPDLKTPVVEGVSDLETAGTIGSKADYPDPDDDDDELEREMLAAFEGGGYDSQAEAEAAAENG
ncbi:NLI interacting factor [Penicillium cf. griseofulvum]|nr:NLI interacting factor [Penicillium cf. griseofulvum]